MGSAAGLIDGLVYTSGIPLSQEKTGKKREKYGTLSAEIHTVNEDGSSPVSAESEIYKSLKYRYKKN